MLKSNKPRNIYTITAENKGNVTLSDLNLVDTLKDFNGNTLTMTEGPISNTGTEVLKQIGNSIYGENSNDNSGKRIAINGDGTIVAIAATGNDGPGNSVFESGHVRVYRWNGTSWVQKGSDIDGEAAGDLSGESVSLSDDGLVLIVGA